jgi:hypothetical protein
LVRVVKNSSSFANYWKVQQIFKISKLGEKKNKTKQKFLDFPLPTFQVPKINNNNNNNNKILKNLKLNLK